jgi:hypothetical protein
VGAKDRGESQSLVIHFKDDVVVGFTYSKGGQDTKL